MLKGKYTTLPARTSRTHCAAWSGWAELPRLEATEGIRFDTNYYYWPDTWALAGPGMFTGSGFPMRFAGQDGALIDVYQAATQLTDELDETAPEYSTCRRTSRRSSTARSAPTATTARSR